ncbi:MAG: hypothetical protein AAFV96_00860, partial [Pseudomonadota bacterium]
MRTTRLTIAACLAAAALVLCAMLPARAGEETKIQAVIAWRLSFSHQEKHATALCHVNDGMTFRSR